ncbi:site-2 protease family protein [Cryptosporangium aurantiacum]|uniref:Zn-dependent protease (Includes SpoIVFB) n=1 Tax=Cryptosporangium aurantiacum TaxID=134849 RepID=A0A1M7JFE0_9ACTN|nr:site-2 protease family protein [Cryptosporangium aurantiacum]SHM51533.1 Zn-dependent protease (includes SpoIVFB) [Cryptosporangium aurantiacum]
MTEATGEPVRQRRESTASRWPSPLFVGLVLTTVVSGWALWTGYGSAGLFAFLFVAAGWVVSLCLHEFAHAVVAYQGGDRSVAERGYLTLDPLKYTHFVYSILLPLLFVLLGGIGLPGGAVFVDRRYLRSRLANSLVSLAGPLTNVVFAAVLAIALAGWGSSDAVHVEFWAAVAFLTFLQVTAAVLNSLPVPGLDGFGVIEPYLSNKILRKVAPIAPYAVLLLFVLLFIPPVNRAFFTIVLWFLELLGVPGWLADYGQSLFRFWLG